MHVKKNTAGSSNEISFSVLDAKKAAHTDSDEPLNEAGKISLFTLSGKTKPSKLRNTSLPTSQGGHHKKASALGAPQQNRVSYKVSSSSNQSSPSATTPVKGFGKTISLVVIVAVVAVLVIVAAQALVNMQAHQNNLKSVLNHQITQLQETDDSLISFDALVLQQVDKNRYSEANTSDSVVIENPISEYETLKPQVEEAKEALNEVMGRIEALQPSLSDNSEKEAAAQALTSAKARLHMIETGVEIITLSGKTSDAYSAAHEGWNDLLAADTAIREASQLMKPLSEDSATQALTKTDTAVSYLTKGDELLQEASSFNETIDFSSYFSYISTRKEAQEYAILTLNAYLDRNKEDLEANNKKYNEVENKAAEIAQSFTETPSELIAASYYKQVEELSTTYESERVNAGNADMFIRKYLGEDKE